MPQRHPGRVSPKTPSAFWRLWGWPLALGVLSASGLVSALVSDGTGDAWAWLALGLPLALIAWHSFIKKRNASQD